MKLPGNFELHPALKLPFGIACGVGFVALCVVAYLENEVLHNPLLLTPGFTHPHHVKSSIVYVSDYQDWLLNTFQLLMNGSFAIGFVLLVVSLIVQLRNNSRSNQ